MSGFKGRVKRLPPRPPAARAIAGQRVPGRRGLAAGGATVG